MRASRTLMGLAIASAIAAACSGPSSPAPSATGGVIPPSTSAPTSAAATPATTMTPAPSTAASLVVYDGRIDVGGGRKLEVRCVGHGSPTILLEGGGITPSLEEWPREFVDRLGQTTTTCAYSRAGGGTSTPPSGTRTMAGLVDDAFTMLAALEGNAGVPGPYVIAGWSFGGEVALAEALAHPDQVKGLVILDTDFVHDPIPTCLKTGRTAGECQQAYDDDIDAAALEHELAPRIHPLPELPVRIITAMQLPDCDPSKPETLHAYIGPDNVKAKDCPTLAKEFAIRQLKGWSTINPAIVQTTVPADHDRLVAEAGDLIAPIILDLVLGARRSS